MHDLIYHRGLAVAHINLGSVISETTKAIVATVSGGKVYSLSGDVIGSLRSVCDPAPDKTLSTAFRKALGIAD